MAKESFPINQQEDTDGKITLEARGLKRACVESNLPYLKMDQNGSSLHPIGAVDSIDQQRGSLTWSFEQQSCHTKWPLLYGQMQRHGADDFRCSFRFLESNIKEIPGKDYNHSVISSSINIC